VSKPHSLPVSRRALGLAAAALAAPSLALAQDFPARPARVIVPYPPGGTTDILARLVSEGLAQKFGQPFVVENRPGAGTALAAQVLVRAPADGYTLLVSTASTTAFMPLLNRNAGYTADQIVAVGMVGRAPLVLDVPANSPFRTVDDLVAFGRANPGRLNLATQGAGATSHLTGELFRAASGISFVPVHYAGSAPGLVATIAGQVDFYFDGVATSAPHIQGGRLRGLGITSERRHRVALGGGPARGRGARLRGDRLCRRARSDRYLPDHAAGRTMCLIRRSATFGQPRQRRTIMPRRSTAPCPPDPNQTASGEPGAVHPVIVGVPVTRGGC